MTEDKYVSKYLKAIKDSINDEEIKDIINIIYEEGFEDGYYAEE